MEGSFSGFFGRLIFPSPVGVSSQNENKDQHNKKKKKSFLEYTDSMGEHVIAEIERTLGKGVTSNVFEIKDNLDICHAVKKLDPSCRTEIKNELRYLTIPIHEGLVKSHGVVITEEDSEIYYDTYDDFNSSSFLTQLLNDISNKNITRVLLFQPKMGIDLRKFQNSLLHQFGGHYQEHTPWIINNRFQNFIINMLSALEHLHYNNTIHRDIKPENIVYNPQKDSWCLTDFGLSREVTPIENRYMTPQMVTLWYRSLSILENSTQYGTEIDLFSLGCVALEILSGEILFPGKESNQHELVSTKINWGPLMLTENYYTENKRKNSQFLRIPRIWVKKFFSMLYEESSKSASMYKEDFNKIFSSEITLEQRDVKYKKRRTSPTSCLSVYSNSDDESFF